MKILIINNSALTFKYNSHYCESRTGEFAKEISSLGHRVTMYGQKVTSSDNIHVFDLEKSLIRTISKTRVRNKLANYLNLYIQIIPEIIKSDLVYIFYPSSFKYVSILCKVFNKPYGLYIRGEKQLLSWKSRWIYENADVIFTVTPSFTKLIKSISNNNHVYTIKPMISYDENHINWKRTYVSPRVYKILFLARVEEDKGIRELILATQTLKKLGFNFHLDIVGSGSYLPDIIKLINELDINDVVEVKGVIKEAKLIKSQYLNSDIYILPTHHEGFPRTLYEAMIFGTPIVTTFVGGIPSVMSNNHNCLEIRPNSSESIVSALSYSMNNYSAMTKLAQNAFKTVEPLIHSNKLSHAAHLSHIIKELYNDY